MGGLPTNKTVYAFAANPRDPKLMLAGLRDGLFKSTDGGESWKKVAKAPRDVAAVVFDPGKPEVVFLGTASGILYRSPDNGATWQRQN